MCSRYFVNGAQPCDSPSLGRRGEAGEGERQKKENPVTPYDLLWLENFFSAVVLKPGGSFLLAQEQ